MVKESLYSRLSGNQEIVAAYIRKCSVKRIFIESSVSSMALQLQELMTANQKVCMKIWTTRGLKMKAREVAIGMRQAVLILTRKNRLKIARIALETIQKAKR
jgi:hypothetical protein